MPGSLLFILLSSRELRFIYPKVFRRVQVSTGYANCPLCTHHLHEKQTRAALRALMQSAPTLPPRGNPESVCAGHLCVFLYIMKWKHTTEIRSWDRFTCQIALISHTMIELCNHKWLALESKIYQLNVKEWEKKYSMQTVATWLISDKTDCRTKIALRDKEGHYIMIK